jgi:hypothetical protein
MLTVPDDTSCLDHLTKQRSDVVIFMLMMMVCSDGLTFGMTLFVPQTELNIDPPGGQMPRPPSGPPVPRSQLLSLYPKGDGDFLRAREMFFLVLLSIWHIEFLQWSHIYYEVFDMSLPMCEMAPRFLCHPARSLVTILTELLLNANSLKSLNRELHTGIY